MGQIDMLAFLIFIVFASCNAELYQLQTADLSRTDDNNIIGRSRTTIEHYPFAVQLIFHGWFRCGGTLMTTRHVLTAAHCVIGIRDSIVEPESTFIRAGTNIVNAGGSLHPVGAIKIHDLYDFKGSHNDIAVVLMATPVDLTTSIARLAYFSNKDAVVPDNAFVTAIGWGTNAVPSSVLKEVSLDTLNLNTCQAMYSTPTVGNGTFDIIFNITSSMICAIIDERVSGNDTAMTESGGALLYKAIVVGVTSWSHRSRIFPKVYVRISNYTNWINYTINEPLMQAQAHVGTGIETKLCNTSSLCNTGSLSSKVRAITLLTSLLYLILSV